MKTILTDLVKRNIYAAVCELYRERYGDDHMANGSCLYWANCGGAILRHTGHRVIVQAGSMSWRILPKEMDDGERPTHFSYEWSPERPESQAALKAGALPEIHVWLALPEIKTLVDFSTKHFPEAANREGLEWRTPPPPDFLWATAETMPEGVFYEANAEAIGFVLAKVWKQEGQYRHPVPLVTFVV